MLETRNIKVKLKFADEYRVALDQTFDYLIKKYDFLCAFNDSKLYFIKSLQYNYEYNQHLL